MKKLIIGLTIIGLVLFLSGLFFRGLGWVILTFFTDGDAPFGPYTMFDYTMTGMLSFLGFILVIFILGFAYSIGDGVINQSNDELDSNEDDTKNED